jgi:hypothetical protein
MGEGKARHLRVDCTLWTCGCDRTIKLEFHGSKISSDAGLLVLREPDEVFNLTELGGEQLFDFRAASREELVAAQHSDQTDQDRRQSRSICALRSIPTGRGGSAARSVPSDPLQDPRPVTAREGAAVIDVVSRNAQQIGVSCGMRRVGHSAAKTRRKSI